MSTYPHEIEPGWSVSAANHFEASDCCPWPGFEPTMMLVRSQALHAPSGPCRALTQNREPQLPRLADLSRAKKAFGTGKVVVIGKTSSIIIVGYQ